MITRRQALSGLTAFAATATARAGMPSAEQRQIDLLPGRESAGRNWDVLQSALSVWVASDEGRITLPQGTFFIDRPLKVDAFDARALVIEGDDTQLIFSEILPRENLAYFWVKGRQIVGSSIRLAKISLCLARPSIRTSGSDLLRLTGFDKYDVSWLDLPSADNMALTIGRTDNNGWVPHSISITHCAIGGLRFSVPHSHGSIGDTAIWIVSPARETRIRHNMIRETGDDGIYVGHATSPEPVSTLIENNVMHDTVGGIGVSVPNAVIRSNHIKRTSVCAIRTETQNGVTGSSASIISNIIELPGQLEAGDIGQRMIPKVHPHGILLYNSGSGARLEGNIIRGARGSGVGIIAPRDGFMSTVTSDGDSFESIGVDRSGHQLPERKGTAAYSKYSGKGRVDGLHATNIHLRNFSIPVINWSLNQEDKNPVIEASVAELQGSRLPEAPIATFRAPSGSTEIRGSIRAPAKGSAAVMIDGNADAVNFKVFLTD